MVRPWAEAGHDCHIVDIQHPTDACLSDGITRHSEDVRLLVHHIRAAYFDIVFAFPPCTNLANSGARWMAEKGLGKLIEALEVVEACRMICVASGAPFMIENPVGQLSTYMGPPSYKFDPYEYGGYEGGENDGYTKKTCLWTGGGFVMPQRRPIDGTEGSRMHLIAPSATRADERSVTPAGFARAVFEANCRQLNQERETEDDMNETQGGSA